MNGKGIQKIMKSFFSKVGYYCFKNAIAILILYAFVFSFQSCGYSQTNLKIDGMTLVAPRDSFSENPFTDLVNINVGWIAVVPYAFTPKEEARVYFENTYQWWGEKPQGAVSTIRLAKENGLKVMVKPQLWMSSSWVGEMEFETEQEWQTWEADYRKYIMTFAEIAERTNAEMLCVGTEFKKALKIREDYWRQLIADIRQVYSGLLTYCSNWDEFDSVEIWDAVDVIGVSSYFPLSDDATPEVDDLVEEWKPIKKRMQALSERYGKQILFTEYGYLSVDGCAGKTWELEKNRQQRAVNEKAQCQSLEALYSTFMNEDYWAGGFMWKWYPNGKVRPGFKDHDYTPQGKAAEAVIKEWYGRF